MSPPPAREVRVVDDLAALAREAAEEWRAHSRAAVAATGRFAVALAGGETPRALHALLADPRAPYRAALPWQATHVFFGDERAVPPEDARSNYRAARETLLAAVPIPPEQVHRIRGEDDPAAAARAYEEVLRRSLGPAPRLVLVLLGMGADGHTASLFPGSPALEERARLVVDAPGPDAGAGRITLTYPALEGASRLVFLVAGAAKAPALAHVLADDPRAEALPAARLRPRDGSVLWLVDRAAASRLPAPP